MGSNPKQQERQPHHSKHFSCPLEKSSCALLAEEEEEEEEWENERPDLEEVMHFGRCVGFATQPPDPERMLKNTLRNWL